MNALDNAEITARLRSHADSVRLAPGSPRAAVRRAAQRRHRGRVAVGAGTVALLGGSTLGVRAIATRPADRVGPVATSSASTTVESTSTAAPQSELSGPLSLGSSGEDVALLKQLLRQLGFDPGGTDGFFTDATEQAVWAAEGLLLGRRPEQKTGTVDAELWQLLHSVVELQPRRPAPGTHVEVYLDLQVAVVFTDDAARLVTHISSGELNADGTPTMFCDEVTIDTDFVGEPLPVPETQAVCAESKTPGGVFTVYRRYEGTRLGPLGGMSNPLYFNYGIAFHGAENVPKFPASHGGVRVPMHIAAYLPSLIANGDTVYVWDGTKEPEDQSLEEMLPSFTRPDTSGG